MASSRPGALRIELARENAMTIAEQAAFVAARADADADFAARLTANPVAVLVELGCDGLAAEVRRECERIRQLAARIDEDEGFRALVERDPAVIVESGFPRDALDQVLRVVGAPDELLDRAKDVATHDALASILGAFAFAEQSFRDDERETRLGPVRRPPVRDVPVTGQARAGARLAPTTTGPGS